MIHLLSFTFIRIPIKYIFKINSNLALNTTSSTKRMNQEVPQNSFNYYTFCVISTVFAFKEKTFFFRS